MFGAQSVLDYCATALFRDSNCQLKPSALGAVSLASEQQLAMSGRRLFFFIFFPIQLQTDGRCCRDCAPTKWFDELLQEMHKFEHVWKWFFVKNCIKCRWHCNSKRPRELIRHKTEWMEQFDWWSIELRQTDERIEHVHNLHFYFRVVYSFRVKKTARAHCAQ